MDTILRKDNITRVEVYNWNEDTWVKFIPTFEHVPNCERRYKPGNKSLRRLEKVLFNLIARDELLHTLRIRKDQLWFTYWRRKQRAAE